MTNTPSIDVLAQRIADRLEVMGLSERQASLQATGGPDAIRYIRTRRAMPSWERLLRIAEVLESDPFYLSGRTEENKWDNSVRQTLDLAKNMNGEAMAQFLASKDGEQTAPCLKSVAGPEIKVARFGGDGQISICTTFTSPPIIHTLSVPQPIKNRSVIGYQIVGRNMEPLYADQSFVLIEMHSQLRLSEPIVVDLGPFEDGGRLSFVAILMGRTTTDVTFRQLDPSHEFQIPLGEIESLFRIVPYSELITFW